MSCVNGLIITCTTKNIGFKLLSFIISGDPNLVQSTAQPATSRVAKQYTDRYTIHNPSTGIKIYALTLYNTHKRHGAEQEATAIDDALQKIPCNCGKKP